MSLDAGIRLGSYEIVSSLGRGGMGEVYRAKDLRLGREVALKVLDPDLASDAERLRRFEQEARAASALNHPNIVHIYDVGEEDGTHYIAMELVEGSTLRQILAEAPLEEARLLELARQLADGLAKAHGAGIVHRDLKPENVMVTADGFVKILDFGLAKLTALPFEMSSDMATLARTRHGMLIGTVEYMSPEQAAGKSVDHRSDQFSLGLILYEMATGKLAFHRETAAQTLASIIENEAPPLGKSAPGFPRGLDAVVAKCLAKDSARRYDDTRELAKSLRALPTALPLEEAVSSVPPVPQDPASGGAPLLGGTIGRYVSNEVRGAIAEVDLELREALDKRAYWIDSGGGRRRLSESRLRRRLRSNRYSGVEMVRREGEERWVPLHETRIFREEIPYDGASADRAAKRKLMGFGQHLCVFLTFGVAAYFATGEVPYWMGFWGIGLVSHAFGTLPAALAFLGRKRLSGRRAIELEGGAENQKPDDLLSASFRDEVARVRALLEKREGQEKDAWIGEIDGIVERMRVIRGMTRDLEEQTAPEEREALERAAREAELRLRETTSVRDRKLYQRQREVVQQRRETIDKALTVLERLRVRQDVTEHQVKQLRLDLARAEASSAGVPELSSRLQDIRHEVDAIDEVDEALARELTS